MNGHLRICENAHFCLTEDAQNRLERCQRVLDLMADVMAEVGARGGSMKSVRAEGVQALTALLADELRFTVDNSEFYSPNASVPPP